MLTQTVLLSPDALFQEIGGEAVILDLATSTYFGLDKVGARFWQLLQDDADLQRAVQQLLQEYDVEAAQLELDLDSLLKQLVAAGLVSLGQT
jgi:Coenzyme PQQ synthesis protein D (PqqD)